MLLLSIARREQSANRETFLAGKPAIPPPAWDEFQKIVGDSPEARKFYVKMYRAEPKMVEAYAADIAKAVSLIEPRCLARKTSHGDDGDPKIPISSMAVYLLIAGDKDAKMSKQAAAGIFDMTGLNHVLSRDWVPFTLALEDGPNKPLLRKLVSRWLGKAKFDSDTACWVMFAAAQHDFKEGLQMALDVLPKIGTPEGHELNAPEKAIPFYVVGRLGDSTHVKKIEPLLKNPELLRNSKWNGQPRDVRICDMALTVLVHLTGQKLKDYNVKNFKQSSWDSDDGISNFVSNFVWRAFFFSNEKERTQAIAQCQQWRKENPTLSPELIYYIVSEPEPRERGQSLTSCNFN